MPGGAFFDLDRTLLSRSSSLALAGTFRGRGLIGRRQLAKAAFAQFVFARFGAGHARVGQTADSAMSILKGLSVDVMHEIADRASSDPESVKRAPLTTPVGRLDEAAAARRPDLRHRFDEA